jgi:hypothetical protein
MTSLFRAGLFLSFALALGCGGNKQGGLSLEGKVTVDGAPAPKVSVILTDKGGHGYRTFTLDDGGFVLNAVPEGEMQVSFEPPIDTGAAMAEQLKKSKAGKDAKGQVPEAARQEAPKVKIATKFTSPSTSGLTWSVNATNTKKDFDLTSK